MKNSIIKFFSLMSIGCGLISLNLGCSDDPAYSSDYDIDWPVPVISNITPGDSGLVSSNITIGGSGLDKIMTITIDNRTMTIVDKTSTSLTATLPRKFNSSAIMVTNLYRQTVKSPTALAPKYPAITIGTFPEMIKKGDPFIVTGTNLDLATSIIIGSNVVALSSTNATSITIPTAGLKINDGDVVVLEIKSTFSKVTGGKSGDIEVVD